MKICNLKLNIWARLCLYIVRCIILWYIYRAFIIQKMENKKDSLKEIGVLKEKRKQMKERQSLKK